MLLGSGTGSDSNLGMTLEDSSRSQHRTREQSSADQSGWKHAENAAGEK